MRAITFNHQLILDGRCRCCILEGNPVHEGLLVACKMFNPALLLNVVLTSAGELARAAFIPHASYTLPALLEEEFPAPVRNSAGMAIKKE
jgi:hypothetical protein